MGIFNKISEKLEKIYEEFKEDKGDLTGWTLMQKIKKESNYEEGLVNYFIYEIFKIACKKGEIINIYNLIAELIVYPYHKESYMDSLDKKDENLKEIFPKLFLEKGILTNILESLELKETLISFYYYLIIKDNEKNEKNYLSEKQISEFKKEDICETRILDIFRQEYKQMGLEKKPKIIKI